VDTHAPFEQQPFGHEAASQTHPPFLHSRPEPQAGPPPQVQLPDDDEQPSAVESHGEQALPLVPHAAAVRVVQIAPVQQPFGQFVALQPVQAPPLQIWLDGQELHSPPPAPHAPWSLPGRQVAPLQQPLHEDVSQMQLPPEQR
jgi:hypothetical protein